MTFAAPTAVISGVPYAVVDVDGRIPERLEHLTGRVEVTVEGATGRHVLRGEAAENGDSVRLHEKSADGSGKDVRTWRIGPDASGGFSATTA
ncbi:hypothetical protein AB6N24_17055 [Cellulomonas sp. 179-A 4D5 NHS]|uniref:hypothetical protein n=1 Tax=Cellulomonas sp. 179-A 4D5 NHS TaxID=3142378 RepID=UPI0039A190AB